MNFKIGDRVKYKRGQAHYHVIAIDLYLEQVHIEMVDRTEKYWADMQPELFQPMFVNNYITIYKVNKPAIPTPKLISWDLD